jgi:gliding motility-associated-like protein
MLNKLLICFFILNAFLLNSQPQIVSLCLDLQTEKRYWVESTLGYSSVWSINPYVGFEAIQDNTIVVNWINPGLYTIVAQFSNGECATKSQFTVQVDECPEINIYIPSAFSPNDDRVNDTFGAQGKGIIDYNLVVFNRWGEEIFVSKDTSNKWDGTYNSNPCQEDVYTYVVKYQGKIGPKKQIYGKVSLIK